LRTTASPPWASGKQIASPLEAVIERYIVSTPASRQAVVDRLRLRSEWQADVAFWEATVGPGETRGGFVPTLRGIIFPYALLPPSACEALQRFALAPEVPTTCSKVTVETRYRDRKKKVWVTERHHVTVVVHGKKHVVAKTSRRLKTVLESVAVEVPTTTYQPCYITGNSA
jgi:hypothetical protein